MYVSLFCVCAVKLYLHLSSCFLSCIVTFLGLFGFGIHLGRGLGLGLGLSLGVGLVLSCRVVSCVVSCLVLSCFVFLSCFVLSCLALSCIVFLSCLCLKRASRKTYQCECTRARRKIHIRGWVCVSSVNCLSAPPLPPLLLVFLYATWLPHVSREVENGFPMPRPAPYLQGMA
jgi:hypothetical protein